MKTRNTIHAIVLTAVILLALAGSALARDGTDPRGWVRDADPISSEDPYPADPYPFLPPETSRPPRQAKATPTLDSAYPPPEPTVYPPPPDGPKPTKTPRKRPTSVPTLGSYSIEVSLGISKHDGGHPPFRAGEKLDFHASLSASPLGEQVEVTWKISGPCDFNLVNTETLPVKYEVERFYLVGQLPAGACGGTYHYSVSANYRSASDEEGMTFKVEE